MEATYKLDARDVAVLLSHLGEIHEYDSIDIKEMYELRYALANLVGEFADQQAPGVPSDCGKRVDLEDFMASRLVAWESERALSENPKKSAVELMEFHLANTGRDGSIDSSLSPLGVVTQYRYALGNAQAWESLEVQLCAQPKRQLSVWTFADLAHSVTLAY